MKAEKLLIMFMGLCLKTGNQFESYSLLKGRRRFPTGSQLGVVLPTGRHPDDDWGRFWLSQVGRGLLLASSG